MPGPAPVSSSKSSMNSVRWTKYSLTASDARVNAPAMAWSGSRRRREQHTRTAWATTKPTANAANVTCMRVVATMAHQASPATTAPAKPP
jgi:hypothetical protein